MILIIILATLLVSAISFVGGLVLFFGKFFNQKMAANMVSFAAGTLLAVTFLEILPKSLEQNEGSSLFLAVFLGIVLFFLLERFVLWFHHHDCAHTTKPAALLVLLGDGVHNFLDGVALSTAFITAPALGMVTTLAIMAHEIPQEISDFSILVLGGFSKKKALFFNFLSGLTALLGAGAGFYFLENIEGALSPLLAFTGGMFIYIACADLIPELHKDCEDKKSWVQILPFLLGIGVLGVLIKLLEG